jgi:hypothetical protein
VNYTNGRYSKLLPARLQARYQEATTNPRLLSLHDDLAAAEARLGDLFQRVDTGESGALWKELRATVEALTAAVTAKQVARVNTHLSTLERLVAQGSDDYQAWDEIQKLWVTRCRLTETEAKTLINMQQMVTAQQLATYFGYITHAIQEAVMTHVDETTGRQILGVISAEFARISDLEERG